jgi:hypothetical protein
MHNGMSHPLNVFITIDTEAWPRRVDWRATRLARDLESEIYGVTAEGEYGIGYQMDMLNAHGLKGVFLVEGLFASAVGIEPLRKMVQLIQGKGHDVQLHIHSEWLEWIEPSILPGRRGQNLKDFTEDEQTLLIGTAARNLREAGAEDLCAFRAGNYGANFDTLRALARNEIRFDTSHNTCYLASDCGMRTLDPLLQPRRILGVWEFPIAYFGDWPGHIRHAQLCACSASEMENALLSAWRNKWYAFVLVSHSFELLKGRKQIHRPLLPDCIVIRRFERLCRFLANNSDRFRTRTFADLDGTEIPVEQTVGPLRNKVHLVAGRMVEQLARRVV